MKVQTPQIIVILCMISSLGLLACNGENATVPNLGQPLPDSSQTDPVNPNPGTEKEFATDVLLFNGMGVSTSDWQTTEKIIKDEGMSYELANTAQMNVMSLEKLSSFGLIVVPGGKGGTIYQNLTTAARLRIRKAVRDHGVGYVGFCAGAWVAVGPEAETDNTASYGFAAAKGAVLPSWYPAANPNVTADMVDVTFADGSKRNVVWWGGPATPEWPGGVIARYDNGKPAISQTYSGKGFVVISGPHPEAPQSWRSTAGPDSDGLDYDLAVAMMNAAMNRQPMATY